MATGSSGKGRWRPSLLLATGTAATILAIVAASLLAGARRDPAAVRPSPTMDRDASRPQVAASSTPSRTAPASEDPTPSQTPETRELAPLTPGTVVRARRAVSLLDADWMIHVGQLAYVVAGPFDDAPGRRRYTIQTWGDLDTGLRPSTIFGTAFAEEAESDLEPAPPSCPTGDVGLQEVSALQPFERLICFGRRDMTFSPVTARDLSHGGVEGEPQWLARMSKRWLTTDGRPDFFTALAYHVHPSIGEPLRINEGWYEVTGHFDDPAASECRHTRPASWDDASSVLWCREQFAITRARPVDPPPTEFRGTWRPIAQAPLRGRSGHVMAWTGRGVIVWGGAEDRARPERGWATEVATGAAYDPARDRWRTIAKAPIARRWYSVSAWTGRELLVWGGRNGRARLRDGAAYDPAADRWRLLAEAPIRTGNSAIGAFLDGSFVVVTDSGAAAYDPSADRWTELPAAPVRPGWRMGAVAADRLIVIAFGDGATPPVEAAVLDPASGAWKKVDVPLEPGVAGIGMFGTPEVALLPEVSLAYDPRADEWSSITECWGASVGGVWTGSVLLGVYGAYEPEDDRCLDMPPAPPRGAPFGDTRGREFPVAAWTGEEYITWSGGTGGDTVIRPSDGAAFRPKS